MDLSALWEGYLGDTKGSVGPHELRQGVLENVGSTQLTMSTVDHPKHYNEHPSGVECITVVEHFNFNLGNAIKYIWRAGLKQGTSDLEDLRKAAWYINREVARLEKESLVPDQHL